MKKLSVILVLVMLITAVLPAQAGILPKSQELIEKVLPSISYVLKRMPDEETSTEDGSLRVTYRNVTAEDYDAFSEYLDTCGCVLVDYTMSGSNVCFTLQKDDIAFILEYDTKNLTAVLTYPAGYVEDRNWAEAAAMTEAEAEAAAMAEAEAEAAAAEAAAMAEAAAAREAELMPYKTIGSYVTFGTYPQTAKGTDKTPIEWLVLDYDEKNNRALLISRYGLDCQPFNKVKVDVTWGTSSLRAWLNDTFLNKAFSKEEQGAILTTDVDNSASQCYSKWSGNGGKNTQDKVFLLSYSEANMYFNLKYTFDSGARDNYKSRTAPTEYAKAVSENACFISGITTKEGSPAGLWWLRSPGANNIFAARVDFDGSLYFQDVEHTTLMVRPAIWLDLSGI